MQTPSTEYLDHPIPEPPLDATDLKKAKPVPAKKHRATRPKLRLLMLPMLR